MPSGKFARGQIPLVWHVNMSGSPSSVASREAPWTSWLQDRGFTDLFDIRPDCAHPFDQIVWRPKDVDRLAAWELYTELRNRITTQTLTFREGDEAAALDSVYSLFELSRSIIKKHPGCTHFAALTVRVLNTRVRPFTAKWHKLKVEGRLSSADVRFGFRSELRALQPWLRKLTHLLGLLADDCPAIAEWEVQPAVPNPALLANLWDPLPFGIAAETSGTKFNQEEINDAEALDICKRRAFYTGEVRETLEDTVGLSISGGGIRSATFALGVVTVFARQGILRQVDYLSTVSGGGYLGAFISSVLNEARPDVTLSEVGDTLPFGVDDNGESRSVRHLRNHSKYLSEGGGRTIVTMIALVAYGVLASFLLVAPFLLTLVLIAELYFSESFTSELRPLFPLSSITVIFLVALVIGVAVLPLAQRFGHLGGLRRSWERGCIVVAFVTALLLVGELFPYLFHVVEDKGGAWTLLAIATLFPFACAGLARLLGPASRGGRITLGMLGVAGPLFILSALLLLFEVFIASPSHPSLSFLVYVTLGLWIYTSFVLNINFASPHSFYRNRLARTYLVRQGVDDVKLCDPQLLSSMNLYAKAPYHLINAALNIPGSKDPDLRGRNTDFFLFSKYYCGSPITGFKRTSEWEGVDPHLDLGTAMAISGAAAAPHMGALSSLRYTFLLAMMNIRLGYWLRRPVRGKGKVFVRLFPPVGWLYFFFELTGLMSEKHSYLNISDGGHIENLGIYELLRRRCKFIIAVDGEADPTRSCGGLLRLTQLAYIDLGVRIEPDLGDLRTDDFGHGRAHFGLSRIDYRGGGHGLLLYIKSSLTGNESEFLRRYRAENPDFPHQSTAQQLFSETQFEAYRALGEHIAGDLFRPDLVDGWDERRSARGWFQSLAVHLL